MTIQKFVEYLEHQASTTSSLALTLKPADVLMFVEYIRDLETGGAAMSARLTYLDGVVSYCTGEPWPSDLGVEDHPLCKRERLLRDLADKGPKSDMALGVALQLAVHGPAEVTVDDIKWARDEIKKQRSK